jgi:hypothetical protein
MILGMAADDERTAAVETVLGNIHELSSLARAHVSQAAEVEDADQQMVMWRMVYGQLTVEGVDFDEVATRIGELLHAKLTAATAFVLHLALDAAQREGVSVIEIINRTERELVEAWGQPRARDRWRCARPVTAVGYSE